MSVVFNVLDTTLEFHDDLKRYYEITSEVQDKHGKLLKRIAKDLSIQKEPSGILSIVETEIKTYIAELINRLSNFGVFDRVASDYLNGNNGYLQLLTLTTEYYIFVQNTSEMHTNIAEANRESASASINSTITGLDFGIISSSIIDHAVYVAMNRSEIRKQSLAAAERYNSVCNTIDNIRDSRISADISGYYANTYIPAITDAISTLYGHLLATYTGDLDACGQLDLHCLDNINLQRSNEIIENIANIDNKKGVFLKALELCPYNLNVYFKGYAEYLLPENLSVMDVCGEIIKYFSLEKLLHNIIVSVDSLCDAAKQYLNKGDYYKAKNAYEEIASAYPKQHYGWLGLLLCETKNFTNTTPDTDLIQDLYKKASQTATDKNLRNKIQDTFESYKSSVLKYKRLLQERDEIMHKEAVAQSNIESARKGQTKWLWLTVAFAFISFLALIAVIMGGNGIFLLLFSLGITAATGYMLADSRKTIRENEGEFSLRFSKEKEISELRNKIIKGMDTSDLF